MFDFLQLFPFIGTGFSTMFDFHKFVLSLVLGCPRRLPLAFVTRQMEPVVERDPIQEHPVLSIVPVLGLLGVPTGGNGQNCSGLKTPKNNALIIFLHFIALQQSFHLHLKVVASIATLAGHPC